MIQKFLRLSILLLALIGLLALPSPLPAHLTTFDLRAYWGASKLVWQGENFADPERMLQLQQTETGWEEEEALMTWNPPWVLAFFLPLAILPFTQASWVWFLCNLFLFGGVTLLIWHEYASEMRWSWLGLLLTFFFTPTLTVLLVGQITALVLLGIVGFYWGVKNERPFIAGLFLSLTLIKPHLLFIWLFLLGLSLLWHRRWHVLGGFFTPIVLGTLVTGILRPTFITDYLTLMGGSRLVERTAVPTLTGFLAAQTGWDWVRFVGLLVCLAVGVWWWRNGRYSIQQMPHALLWALVISYLLTPFGWSFDTIIYLFPLQLIAIWGIEQRLPRSVSLLLLVSYLFTTGFMFYQRSQQLPESAYFWLPLLLTAMYAISYYSLGLKTPANKEHL